MNAKGKVRLGDEKLVKVEGKGSVLVNTNQGIRIINEVLFVPSLKQNLLSVCQMMNKVYTVAFENKRCNIHDTHGTLITTIPMVNKNFARKMTNSKDKASYAAQDEANLWHMRYEHFHMASLKKIHTEGLAKDLPLITSKQDICGIYQIGKMHRIPFPSQAIWRAKEELELVHSDICGPMNVDSMNDNKYFALFIDDLTRMT